MTSLTATTTDRLLLKMQDQLAQSDIEKLRMLQGVANLLTTHQEFIHLNVSLTGAASHLRVADGPSPYIDVNVTIEGKRLIMMPLKLKSQTYGLLDPDTRVADMVTLDDLVGMLTPRGLAAYVGRLNQHAHLRAEHREVALPEMKLPKRL